MSGRHRIVLSTNADGICFSKARNAMSISFAKVGRPDSNEYRGRRLRAGLEFAQIEAVGIGKLLGIAVR